MRPWLARTWPWVALLAGAALWRLLLFAGPLGSDDLYYSRHAHDLIRGSFQPVPDLFSERLGYLLPIALVYGLLGAGSLGLVLPNLLASLAGIVLTRRLALEYLDEAGAWTAAGLLALFPLDAFFATEAHPDLPLSTLLLGSAVLFLRAKRQDRWRDFVAAGLVLGVAHWVKEAAFFGLAALAALGGRPRIRYLWTLAGFGLLVATECVFYAAASSDPLYRVRVISTAQPAAMDALYPEGISLVSRVGRTLVGFFIPAGGAFPFFGLLPLLALIGAAVGIRRRDLAVRPAALWALALILLLLFWPTSLRPYRPALQTHPRIFLIAAAPIAILAAYLLRAIPRKAALAAAALYAIVAIPCSFILRADARNSTAGARAAYESTRGQAVVSDARTVGLFRLYDGYREDRMLRAWEDPRPEPPFYFVANETWTARLREWYGIAPPAGLPGPDAPRVFHEEIPGRLRLRPLLLGRIEREAPQTVEVYEVQKSMRR